MAAGGALSRIIHSTSPCAHAYDIRLLYPERIDRQDLQAIYDALVVRREGPGRPSGDYRAARGVLPHDPETPKAEVLIRRIRDAWEEDA
jgi:hypothetical protein